MNKAIRNIIAGIGSVLAIMPSGTVAHIKNPNQRSDSDNLRTDWERVGSYFYSAIQKTEDGKTKV